MMLYIVLTVCICGVGSLSSVLWSCVTAAIIALSVQG